MDEWFAQHEDEFAETAMRLMRVPSVGAGFDPASAEPFGHECARVLEEACSIAGELGFEAENLDGYAVRVLWRGVAEGEAPGLAFYSHLDVVPAGGGWSFDPFAPFVKDGMIWGRGGKDDKGPAVTVLYAMRFLREAGFVPERDVCLYLGVDEESGMRDIAHVLDVEPLPQVNLVADASFPVLVGEKGILVGVLAKRLDDAALLDFAGGIAHNAVPAQATARIRDAAGSRVVNATGMPAHASQPEGAANAILELARTLAEDAALSQATRDACAFLVRAFDDCHGSGLNIQAEDDMLGPTTAVASIASLEDGVLRVTFDVRFPDSLGVGNVRDHIAQAAAEAGFSLEDAEGSAGYRRDANDALVRRLTAIANDELGMQLEPYAMGGGTHARHIPGGLGFGPALESLVSPLGPDRGGEHQPDEVVELASLRAAFRIYVRTIKELA